jgi:hypothetical protein
MAISVTHTTVVATSDDGTSDVGSDEWNAAHTVSGVAASDTTVTAGAGLTGGGDLSANRTIAVGAGTGITVNADDVAITVPVAVASGGTGQVTEAEAVGELIQALTEDTTPDVSTDYIGTYDASADTGKKVLLSTVVRKLLTQNTSYYVRTDGSDSNDGTANTAGGAWLTLQHAYDWIADNLDFGGYEVTLNVADGTYSDVNEGISGIYGGYSGGAWVALLIYKAWVGGGAFRLIGNATTPDNVYINATGVIESSCIVVAGCSLPGPIYIKGFKLFSDHEGINLLCAGTLNIDGPMVFAANTNGHIVAGAPGAYVNVGRPDATVSYTIVGGGARHLQAEMGGVIFVYLNTEIVATGTPVFNAFADAQFNGVIYNNFYTSISGAMTGIGAFCRWGGVISGTGFGTTGNNNRILEGGTIRGKGRFIDKYEDQSRSSTTALASDSLLTTNIGVSEARHFKFRIWYSTPTAADFKFDINGPASPTSLRYTISYIAPDDTSLTTGAIQTAYNVVTSLTATTNTDGYVEVAGVMENGSNEGALSFRWAQDTSNGSNTTVLAGSGLETCPLG